MTSTRKFIHFLITNLSEL